LRSIVGGGDIRNVIEARLLALSRSHDLLTRENWESADLRQVALHALEPFADRHGSLMQFTIEGPDVRLSPKMALALGMAFHELGTNATKYGALRHDGGRIDLSWLLVGATGSDLVRLLWRERGGPEVQAPLRKGFGSRLLEERLAQELDGEVGLDYRVEGLICRIDMPAPKPRGAQYAQ
jgi:two-component sensor histidine kinase